MKEILTEIHKIISTLESNIKELKDAELSDKIPLNIRQVAINSRATFIKRIHTLIGLRIPSHQEIKEIKRFYQSGSQAVKDTFKRAIPYYRYAKVLFKKQTEFIPKNLKILETLFNDLKNLLDVYEPQFSRNDAILNSISELQSKAKTLDEYKENIRNAVGRIELLKKNLLDVEAKMKRLTEDPEWKNLNTIIALNEKLKIELQNIKSEMLQNISPLQKSFKKFSKHVNGEKESFEERKMLEFYINSPIFAIDNDTELTALKTILKRVSNAIQTDKLELKDEKKKRTLAQINMIMETGRLTDLVRRYGEIKNCIKENDERISKIEIQKQKDSYAKENIELNRQIKDLENNIQELDSNRKTLISQIREIKANLEEELEQVVGSKISITGL